MRRRDLLLAGAATALPLPAVAQPAKARVLRFVPQANLTVLNPILTTAGVTLDHSYAVFDTLFATGSDFHPVPQMADGYDVVPDRRASPERLIDAHVVSNKRT